MSKISLTNLVNLNNQTTAVNAINANNAVLTAALDNTVSRDGTSPNQMGASFDMNSNRILNLPAPTSDQEPLRRVDGITAGLVGPIGPQGIQGPAGTNGTGIVNSITAGTGITVSGTATVPVVTNTGVTSVVAGSGITVTGTTIPTISVSGSAGRTYGTNLLPNTNWQLFTQYPSYPTSTSSRMNVGGTAFSPSVSVSSFSTSTGLPTFNSANTGDLVDGDIVTFGVGNAIKGLTNWGNRIFTVVPNTSFKTQINFSQSTPASSSAITAWPVGMSNVASNAYAPDGGWQKTASALAIWADDWVANRCPGAKRVLGLRKSANVGESIFWRPKLTPTWISSVRGRTVSFGALVRQKVGGGQAYIYINDGTTVTQSAVTTGSSYVNAAYNNYEFLTCTATISSSTNFIEVGLFTGSSNTGDIMYLAIPTLKFGTNMQVDDLGQPAGELIRANTHWNPLSLVPFGSASTNTPSSWPGAEIIAGSGLYGWADIDLEAISYRQVHNSIIKANAKIEYTTPTVGSICFVGALDVPGVQLTFGLQADTKVANITTSTNMSMVPLINGTSTTNTPPGCFAMFSNEINGTISTITFDFDDVIGS